jgi:hypothetical protein
MSNDRRKLPVARPGVEYEVGYGKPPTSARFKPGQSGNPKGRPKGARKRPPKLNEERLKTIILDEAYRDIAVRDGDRNVTMSMAQAIIRALAVNAAKGQHRAQRLFAEMLASTERQNKALADAWLSTAMDYKIEWDRELERRRRFGITDLPDPLPHPDQIKIDMIAGEAWVVGPMTKDEKAHLDWLAHKRDEFQLEIDDLHGRLETEHDEKLRSIMQSDLKLTQSIVQKLEAALQASEY